MSKQFQPEPNDDPLDQLLSQADPARNCDLDPSIDRLKSGIGFQPVIHSKKPVIRQFTLAAGILLSLGGSLWWLSHLTTPDKIALEDHAIEEADSSSFVPEKSPTPKVTSDLPPREKDTETLSDEKEFKRVVEVTSVKQLIQELANRKPVQRFPAIELDEAALQFELGEWLVKWSSASPEQRQELESIWNENRVYWLPWSKTWCGSWENKEINIAAIEAIATDEKADAVPFLTKFIADQTLRQHAWAHICRSANVNQLAELLPVARTCDEVQTLAAALIRDASPQSTDLLIAMSAQPSCRQAIQRLKIEWPANHARHCWNTLKSRNNDFQTAAAATLLSEMAGPQIDAWLAENLRMGRHQLQIVSLLLMRETPAARRLLASVQDNRVLASNLPSAKQQVFRWNLTLGKASILSPQVCEQCTVSS